MTKIFMWASPHVPTQKQIEELNQWGEVKFLKEEDPTLFNKISSTPSEGLEIHKLARELMEFVVKTKIVLVQPAGNPAFQFELGKVAFNLSDVMGERIEILYSHSERISKDIPLPDGKIEKRSVFEHSKFVPIVTQCW